MSIHRVRCSILLLCAPALLTLAGCADPEAFAALADPAPPSGGPPGVPNATPRASFTTSCTDLTCRFDGNRSTDSDGAITNHAWTFGDGTSGSGSAPSHTYAGGGAFSVTLTVTDDRGAFATSSVTLTVTEPQNKPPSPVVSSTCTHLSCTFDATASADTDGSIASYSWDFGDGSTAMTAMVTHTFATVGAYEVTLTVTDDEGATAASTRTVTVSPAPVRNIPPTPVIAFSCTALTCAFDGAGSIDSDGSIASYAWSFGDGATASAISPLHTFAAGGSYSVVLTVTDNAGASSARNVTATVAPPSNKPPSAVMSSSCTDLACSFDATASTDSDGTIASYVWDFGDGTGATGPTSAHSYTAEGTFTVRLTVTDNTGASAVSSRTLTVSAGVSNDPPSARIDSSCSDLVCSFDAGGSTDSDGTIAIFSWDLGDGTTSSALSVAHTYASAGEYDVVLTVTDDAGATGSQTVTITAAEPPNVSPSALINSSCIDLACSFDASGSTDSDGTIASFGWNFGDGTTSAAVSATHTYASAGDYNVVLTVTDDAGATGSQTVTITATEPPNVSPTALISSSCIELVCSFDASGSSDSDGTIAGYGWDLGDGSTSAAASVVHDYDAAGNYEVVLIVTDDAGATSSQSVIVTAAAPSNMPPAAVISTSCADLVCTFDATESTDGDGTIAGYAWDFGDGATSTAASVTHTYAAAGIYDLVLSVTDNVGATSTSAETVAVTDPTLPPDGRILFAQNCAACHGDDARGGLLGDNIVGKDANDIRDAIADEPEMEPMEALTDAEIEAIADYLEALDNGTALGYVDNTWAQVVIADAYGASTTSHSDPTTGSFVVDSSALAGAIIARAYFPTDGTVLYGYADTVGMINVTPLTDLALRLAAGPDLMPACGDVMAGTEACFAVLSSENIALAERAIADHLAASFALFGVDADHRWMNAALDYEYGAQTGMGMLVSSLTWDAIRDLERSFSP